jgi:hypothetical protein
VRFTEIDVFGVYVAPVRDLANAIDLGGSKTA